jgi:hypothetical protein
MMRAGPGTIRMRCAHFRQTTAPVPLPVLNPTEPLFTPAREACMSVPSVRPSEGSPCRTPPTLRSLGLAASHARPRTHGTPHAREIDRACSPLVAAPALQPPRAASLIVLLLVCCRAECACRHVPNWTRRNLGGISAVAHGPDGISAVSGRPHCRRRLVCSARAAAPLPLSRNACLVPRAETASHSPRACPGCIQTKPCALRHGACLTRPTTWAAPAAERAPEPAESASPWQSPSARVRSSSLRWSA